ncbi:FtsX-like permease family protein [Lysinibacillus odysseyi]|uniref:ABC transporter permease n=1 Tax=Lysinibacillus odysseyi 34hs-1 = NBRC 100172 TaxID=1220589 RepID=A0A0A3ITE1_9BACI|nr:FtsX-like permease family protein [Lysinibacillus odysseyi]KGR86710.1 ABC transporter permease [Lysinibacillus odysseyi 34hs-1 = NBRC 100172]
MSLNQLVFRSMLKNMKQYFLYFFALIFSVTLYFSFVTLQYNKSVMEQTANSGTAASGFEAATYMLYFIVLFFVLYANHLFMKRRSKEMGMYQLIGMTKGLIFRLIALENVILFVGAVVSGMVFGFLSSRLFAMILLKLLEQNTVVEMAFSKQAVIKTAVVFAILLIIILIQMAWMIRRVTLINLFTASKQADERVKRFSPVKMAIGAIGIGLIAYGYYASTNLFDINSGANLFLNMLIILVTTIGGTFLVFRFSVSFVMNLLRLKKNGHLNIVDVLAVTPIMHRMKGNAKSLTLITVLTAVSLAIMTLSYISYYSVDVIAYQQVPADYTINNQEMDGFLKALDEENIAHEVKTYHLKMVEIPMKEVVAAPIAEDIYSSVGIISLSDYQQIDAAATLQGDEVFMESHFGYLAEMFPIKSGKELTIRLGTEGNYKNEKVRIKDVREEPILTSVNTGGSPILVVSDAKFEQYPSVQAPIIQQSVILQDKKDMERADKLYEENGSEYRDGVKHSFTRQTQEEVRKDYLGMLGVTIFTTAFLGLAFLLATCSILYFKQTAEADEQKDAFTIMRKIGFSEQELMRGIYAKQLFNFGVPLLIGLLHSYFAVKSGWFLFGTELMAPMLITMGLYIVMYIIFAILSISYYRKVIRETL